MRNRAGGCPPRARGTRARVRWHESATVPLRRWLRQARAAGVLGLGLLVGLGCRITDPDHCANRVDAAERTEHAWCLARHELPYCDHCQRSSDRNGCTDIRPATAECLGSEPGPDGMSSSGAESSESGPPPCSPDGPSDACAALDPLTPFCREGACVPCDDGLCADGVCDPRPAADCVECRPDAEAPCPGEARWCNDDLECVAECTRHEQCPASACELVDGVCIPPEGAIAWVDADGPGCRASTGADWSTPITYCALEDALADAPDVAVIRLRAVEGGYYGPWTLAPASVPGTDRTVVLMADPEGEPVTLRSSSTLDSLLLGTVPKTRLYLHRLALRGVGAFSQAIGIDCAGLEVLNTHVRLDDVELSGLSTGIRASDCAVRVSRSRVHDNGGIGIDVLRRALTLESSVVALNAGVGVRADSADVEVRFSSLLGNGRALAGPLNLACEGDVGGEVTGSLFLLPQISGSTVSCGALVLDERTLTEQDLAGYDELADLFSDVVTGQLADPTSNPITTHGLVVWRSGDPYFDVDGQARPRLDRPGVAPGANEP